MLDSVSLRLEGGNTTQLDSVSRIARDCGGVHLQHGCIGTLAPVGEQAGVPSRHNTQVFSTRAQTELLCVYLFWSWFPLFLLFVFLLFSPRNCDDGRQASPVARKIATTLFIYGLYFFGSDVICKSCCK